MKMLGVVKKKAKASSCHGFQSLYLIAVDAYEGGVAKIRGWSGWFIKRQHHTTNSVAQPEPGGNPEFDLPHLIAFAHPSHASASFTLEDTAS
jgi:hypothetical protein